MPTGGDLPCGVAQATVCGRTLQDDGVLMKLNPWHLALAHKMRSLRLGR